MSPPAAPPRFGPLQLALAAAGTAAATLDLCMDGWVAAEYARRGHPGWAALSLSLLAAASAAAQACSWLWLRSDPPALRPAVPGPLLAALHFLQLGFFFRYGSPAPRSPPRVPGCPPARPSAAASGPLMAPGVGERCLGCREAREVPGLEPAEVSEGASRVPASAVSLRLCCLPVLLPPPSEQTEQRPETPARPWRSRR